MKKEKWEPYNPKNNDKMVLVLAGVPNCFAEVRRQIKMQLENPWPEQNTPKHWFETYGVDIYKMSWADLCLIEARAEYWLTGSGGKPADVDPAAPTYQKVMEGV